MLGAVNDAFFRWVVDIGVTGPDQGRGGRYLFLPSDYTGPVPDSGFHVARSKTNMHWMFARAFVVAGDIGAAIKGVKDEMKVYLLSEAANPPEETFVNFSGMQMNTIHANDVTFYDELNAVVQNESIRLSIARCWKPTRNWPGWTAPSTQSLPRQAINGNARS